LVVIFTHAVFAETSHELSDKARDLLQRHPGLQVFVDDNTGEPRSFYGRPIKFGSNPFDSAEQFRLQESEVFGLSAQDLRPGSLIPDNRHSQPLMYDADTDTYKLTAVFYRQYHGDIPVFRSVVKMVVRNEEGYPLVLVKNNTRPMEGFVTDGIQAADAVDSSIANARAKYPGLAQATLTGQPEKIIWAGYHAREAARLAITYTIHDLSVPSSWLIVADAKTGELIYEENQRHDVDVVGNVSGIATEGYAADICEEHSPLAMPYAWVGIDGGNFAYADEFGDYVISNPGTGNVTVRSEIRGPWFNVDNAGGGGDAVITANVAPPGPADFMHNPTDVEITRAQVDAYIHSNIVRDRILMLNPAFPVIGTQMNFDVNVNQVGGICPNNAQYISSGPSINFCLSSGSGPNMAWSVVVYHEYGHHVVQMGGSGQCEYGEGMSDVVGFLVSDESGTGFGFLGDCDNPLRDADNSCQYSASSCTTNCGGPCHNCGRLLSGSIWDVRTNLMVTNPLFYRNIVGALTVNSIILHTGSGIDPDIAIDFLTLDDNDGNINNGTPHYTEICDGFNAHGLNCPELASIFFEYPAGLPEVLVPETTTEVTVNVEGLVGTPQPGTGALHYRFNGQGIFVMEAMDETAPNEYTATLPGTPCGDTLEYYFSAEDSTGDTLTDPPDISNGGYTAFSAVDTINIVTNNMQSDNGWSVSGAATDGQWDRGVPITNCVRGNPTQDFDGSGACWLTDNSSANQCNSDVDGGTTSLTTAIYDVSSLEDPRVSFARWFSNTAGDSPNQDTMINEISDDGGASWVTMETVGPTGPQSTDGWFKVSYRISDFVALTNQVRFRFNASDTGAGSVVEAAIDDFNIDDVVCVPSDAPPFVSDQPDNAAVCESETANFSVSAQGSGPFTYQWFKDNNPIADATMSTLSVPNATVADEGSYHCDVTNEFGTTSSEDATLNVVQDIECDDTNACTVDSCAAAVCINTDDTPPGDCCNPANGDLQAISDGDGCTNDVCNPDGSVSHTDNYDTETQCCDPSNGDVEVIDDANACTDDVCNPDGSVAHNDNYDVETQCCNPGNGDVVTIDDGDDCTTDVCSAANGQVTRSVATPTASEAGPRVISAAPAACDSAVALLVTSDDHPCLSLYVDENGNLGDTPVFQTPATWTTVNIRAEELVPSSSYRVQTESSTGVLSDGSVASTWVWGDVDNNGVVNFADVQLIVNVFQGDLSGATVEAADLEPCLPNAVINLADAQRGIQAFQLQTYEDTGCPDPCP
jgi:hypothetical protein